MKLPVICLSVCIGLLLSGCCCNPFRGVTKSVSACYKQVKCGPCVKPDGPMFSSTKTEVCPRPMLVGPKWSNADAYNGLDKVTNTETL
ncbi:hypothetical protein GX645_06410 [Candidatus Sumerlaeota bacterium]|nr:hypothetical protein [Candidatus Sumerlaeales bacterium]NLD62070.1 hypothetical protein [Candidatus Sumerlaeota bacterium]